MSMNEEKTIKTIENLIDKSHTKFQMWETPTLEIMDLKAIERTFRFIQ